MLPCLWVHLADEATADTAAAMLEVSWYSPARPVHQQVPWTWLLS